MDGAPFREEWVARLVAANYFPHLCIFGPSGAGKAHAARDLVASLLCRPWNHAEWTPTATTSVVLGAIRTERTFSTSREGAPPTIEAPLPFCPKPKAVEVSLFHNDVLTEWDARGVHPSWHLESIRVIVSRIAESSSPAALQCLLIRHAEALSPTAQDMLRRVMEVHEGRLRVVMTHAMVGCVSSPLLSRVLSVSVAHRVDRTAAILRSSALAHGRDAALLGDADREACRPTEHARHLLDAPASDSGRKWVLAGGDLNVAFSRWAVWNVVAPDRSCLGASRDSVARGALRKTVRDVVRYRTFAKVPRDHEANVQTMMRHSRDMGDVLEDLFDCALQTLLILHIKGKTGDKGAGLMQDAMRISTAMEACGTALKNHVNPAIVILSFVRMVGCGLQS